MTYEELGRRVSAAEFELWLGLAMLRQDECPHCGIAPEDLMVYEAADQHCPVCKSKYHKIKRLPERK